MLKKRYSEEFKRMVCEKMRQGVPPSQLAREYEPRLQTLYRWKRAMLHEGPDAVAESAAKIRQLEKQVRQLKEDREILEKAATWFARAHGPGLSR